MVVLVTFQTEEVLCRGLWDLWWDAVFWDCTGLIMKYVREGQKVGERESLRWFGEGQAWEKRNKGPIDCKQVAGQCACLATHCSR